MKLANHAAVPVYVIAGASTARALPEWLARKRKRSLKNDPEYTSRVELLQDFEFEEASQCVRVSEDGNWVMSTGTYKPQIHTHNLPNLALSFARHTVTLNTTFEILSSDYSKSVHLQADRALEFHTPEGCRYTTRIPRYGRDLKFSKRSTETLVPAAGVNQAGNGEVYRLHLEQGRFMRPYEIDVGGDDLLSTGAGSIQGGIRAGSVNSAAIAEDSHNLLAFGTSIGTVEFWDPRARERVGLLQLSADALLYGRQETTALEFDHSGLNIACGTSSGLVQIFDLRSPTPLLEKDQGYGCPIKTLMFLTPSAKSRVQSSEPKLLSADKRIIKIWDARNGAPWTSVEPAVDINSVAWCRDSGMLLTANEGRQQHAFLIPQLGPAPSWCSFLDNLVEEMAEDADDPNAFTPTTGEVYENYKFLTNAQLESLNLAHLIGTTNLLRPYMHGFFVAQKLYEEARLIADPFVVEDQRAKRLKEKLEKERESRIRGNQRLPGKVNKALAEKIISRTTRDDAEEETTTTEVQKPEAGPDLLSDPRFAKLFTDKSYAIDEGSKTFKDLNPNTPNAERGEKSHRRLTAVEEEELHAESASSSSSSDQESTGEATEQPKPKSKSKPSKRQPAPRPPSSDAKLTVSSSVGSRNGRDRTFGSRAARHVDGTRFKKSGIVGEQETSFVPTKRGKKAVEQPPPSRPVKSGNRRSASGNVMRTL